MRSYILGYYVSDKRLKVLTEKRRMILNAFLNSYPATMKVKDIASIGGFKNEKQVYAYHTLDGLVENGFIWKAEEHEERGGGVRGESYFFENVNSLLRDRRTKYPLAPGNVEYDEEFKSALNKLINEVEIKDQCRTLFGFVKYIVERVKESNEEDIKRIAPKKDSDYFCFKCGLNHEARDFIRATLLYLIDQFERSSDYLEFLREKNYIDNEHCNEYRKLIQTNLGQRISKGLIPETQFTRPEPNEDQIMTIPAAHKVHSSEKQITLSKRSVGQIVAEHWFEKKMGLTKRMAEHILSEMPETSKEQLMNLTNSQKSKTRSRSDLDAIYEVGKELGVSYSDDLEIDYNKRKKQEAYENRVRDTRVERRKKLRARKRQTSN